MVEKLLVHYLGWSNCLPPAVPEKILSALPPSGLAIAICHSILAFQYALLLRQKACTTSIEPNILTAETRRP